MPNKPRPENRHRMVRVEDELWEAAKVAAAEAGTTRAAVMREALRALVETDRAIEWGVRWPDDEIRWVPGGELTARQMASSAGSRPFTRVDLDLGVVTAWAEVRDE